MALNVILLTLLVALTRAQDLTCMNQTVNSTDKLSYFTTRFPDIDVKAPTRNPYLGGRNLTYCCIQAVDEWLRGDCNNQGQFQVNDNILTPGIQFPCGAAWAGNTAGAPEVKTSYAWAWDNCPGWEISQAQKANEWAQLLVSFILPAIVFSFNIPRPRKLKLWEKLFPKDLSSYRLIGGIAGAIVAAICVTIDTVVWLMISMAFAGPLLLSGLYEAQLDKRVLDYLHERIKHDKLPLALRARILFTILCGNLDLYPAWGDMMDLARRLDQLDKSSPEFRRYSQLPAIQVFPPGNERTMPSPSITPLGHSRSPSGTTYFDQGSRSSRRLSFDDSRDTDPLRPNPDERQQEFPEISIRDYSNHRGPEDVSNLQRVPTAGSAAVTESGSVMDADGALPNTTYDRPKTIRKVTVRLRAMLACQYSFGSTIGGPVVFFIGAFIFALLELKDDTGDENIAEALAFGMWWIIIPHIAAIAGLLLAGNNPNILEGIVSIRDLRYTVGESLIRGRLERRTTIDYEAGMRLGLITPTHKKHSGIMERVYEADYTPAWMWDRGRSKQDWLLVLFTDSWLKYQHSGTLPLNIRKGLEDFLIEGVMLGPGDWIFLWFFAFLLIFIPCLFGFLAAFFTPPVGIACRAITFLLYMGAQTLLLILWTYYLTWRDNYWATGQKVKRILQRRATSTSEAELANLVNELKHQAMHDTNMPEKLKRGLRDSGSIVSLSPDLNPIEILDKAHPVVKVMFYVLCVFGFVLSLLTSIGGSLMQTMGVYRSTLCLAKASDWTRTKRLATIVTLSTNTRDAILQAQKDWSIIGGFSVTALGIVCYIGWWYQKRLRRQFKKIAEKLDGDRTEREMFRFAPE